MEVCFGQYFGIQVPKALVLEKVEDLNTVDTLFGQYPLLKHIYVKLVSSSLLIKKNVA